MSDNGASFILLHGAGLGSWIWDPVIPHLGAPAEAVDLPGREGPHRPADVTLQTSVAFVSDRVGPRSILVGHSIGAEVAMAVAAARPQSVAAVVLVGGMVPESGRSFMSLLPIPQRIFLHVLLRLSRNGVLLPKALVESEYCSDLNDEMTREVLERVVSEAPRLYLDRVHWRSIPDSIPRFYVKLDRDKSVPSTLQEEVRARSDAVEWDTLPTGHLPMLSEPRRLADSLNRLLQHASTA